MYGGSQYIREAPHNFSLYFWRGLLGFKNIIRVKPNGNSPIYIFACQQVDFDNLLQKVT